MSAVYPTRAAERFAIADHSLRPGSIVIAVFGEVDLFTSPLLHTRLQENIHHGGPDLIVDLTGVSFFGTSGLTVLSVAWEATVTAGIEFRVVARTRTVLLPLRLTGLDRVFDVVSHLSTPS